MVSSAVAQPEVRAGRGGDWKCETGWNYNMSKNCAKSSASEMFLVPASELTMVSFKGKSKATMKWHQSKPQRKEIWDQCWYILDIPILFLWWKAVFPECMKYFLTLLQTTDLNYTEVSGVYVLFLFFIFDAYILIFICDIGTIVPRRQICH